MAVEPISKSMMTISRKLSTSYAITIIFSYFDIEDAIKFQLLNKHMYEKKTPQMCFQIVGRKIEPEVCIYDVYPHSKNKLSVVVGPAPTSEDMYEKTVDQFLKTYPMFASKFAYENFSWKCVEDKKMLVSVFRFKAENYRIRLSPN